MESNSERNRIQVSQSTADLLIADGKRHWLTPREDLVDAKGKGLLQTFWCEPQSARLYSSITESFAYSLSKAESDLDEDAVVDRGMDDGDVPDVENAFFDSAKGLSEVSLRLPEPPEGTW
jgi:hypothetical protein